MLFGQPDARTNHKALFPSPTLLYNPNAANEYENECSFRDDCAPPEKNFFATTTALFDAEWTNGVEEMKHAIFDDVDVEKAVASGAVAEKMPLNTVHYSTMSNNPGIDFTMLVRLKQAVRARIGAAQHSYRRAGIKNASQVRCDCVCSRNCDC